MHYGLAAWETWQADLSDFEADGKFTTLFLGVCVCVMWILFTMLISEGFKKI